MNKKEISKIIKSIKKGETYFKPLPYHDVEGGTWITFDPEKNHFVERYINRSIYDRGTEDYTTNFNEEKLREMFEKESYTDRNYIFPKRSEEYEMLK